MKAKYPLPREARSRFVGSGLFYFGAAFHRFPPGETTLLSRINRENGADFQSKGEGTAAEGVSHRGGTGSLTAEHPLVAMQGGISPEEGRAR